MIFTSRVKASECFGGMNLPIIGRNIREKTRSKIKGGEYKGLYVMFYNKPIESILFEGIEIKPAPTKSERVKGQKYVINNEVRIWSVKQWNCVAHNIYLSNCVECGGGSLCDCGVQRHSCRNCRVQPMLECTKCSVACFTPAKFEEHMRTHSDARH